MAIKVRLKPKAKKDGSQRIFLDIWHHRRWHETTAFRVTPEMSDKEVKLVMAEAEAHAATRWAELVRGEAAEQSGELSKVRFVDYYKLVADTKDESTRDVWYGAYPAIAAYAGKTRLKDIDPSWLRGMVDHLSKYISDRRKKVLSQNTQANYYARVRATIWHAYRDELIADNPAARVRGVAQVYARRRYLKIEEIEKLAATPLDARDLKKAAMFNFYMGLRVQDLIDLTWSCIEYRAGEYVLVFEAAKDDEEKYIPIPAPALEWLPERGEKSDESRVFYLYGQDQFNRNFRRWAQAAGIKKDVTSHVIRHTMAVQALDAGLDESDLRAKLGHSINSPMTAHYARISNRKMREAARKFPCLTPSIQKSTVTSSGPSTS